MGADMYVLSADVVSGFPRAVYCAGCKKEIAPQAEHRRIEYLQLDEASGEPGADPFKWTIRYCGIACIPPASVQAVRAHAVRLIAGVSDKAAPAGSPTDPIYPFGRDKGKPISAVDSKSLKWALAGPWSPEQIATAPEGHRRERALCAEAAKRVLARRGE